MKQKDKELLFKDLCARLPYGVKCSFGVDDAIYVIEWINPNCCGASEIQATHIKSGINGDFTINACKPYLFPLSSMIEKQVYYIYEYYTDTSVYEFDEFYKKFLRGKDDINILFTSCSFLFDYLNKNHFDYRGLIPMGLAIDCTNLNIYWLWLDIIKDSG